MELRMKICHISDTHKQHNSITVPPCDLLLHTGDIGGRTSYNELNDFLNWFGRQPARAKVFIAGNHDIILDLSWRDKLLTLDPESTSSFERDWSLGQDLIEQFSEMGVVYLEDEEYVFEGLKIYGSPWTPSFHPKYWVFNADRGEDIKAKWDVIPADTDILLTHGPCMGILDTVAGSAGERVGCIDLLRAVNSLEALKLHCCGHIHENTTIVERRGVIFSNGAVLDDRYEVVLPTPGVIDL